MDKNTSFSAPIGNGCTVHVTWSCPPSTGKPVPVSAVSTTAIPDPSNPTLINTVEPVWKDPTEDDDDDDDSDFDEYLDEGEEVDEDYDFEEEEDDPYDDGMDYDDEEEGDEEYEFEEEEDDPYDEGIEEDELQGLAEEAAQYAASSAPDCSKCNVRIYSPGHAGYDVDTLRWRDADGRFMAAPV